LEIIMKYFVLVALVTLSLPCFAGPEIPGAKQEQPIALTNGVIHTVSGETIEGGTLLFEKGKIKAVGKEAKLPAEAEVIDLEGKHVYPGLFDAYTDLGLVEINSVRATVDNRETGEINPNVKAETAVNPDSEIIPTTRSNGVLLGLVAPRGGMLSGRSAVIQLDGWTWEDMTLKSAVALHVQWPKLVDWADPDEFGHEPSKLDDSPLKPLEEAFAMARAYQLSREANPEEQAVDARWEAMLPVLAGQMPIVVHANEIQQIQTAVAFAHRHKLKLIIYGGYDAPRAGELLKRHNVPVIVEGIYRLPWRKADPYDSSYTVPARLHAAGVKFCITSANRFGASGARNLPYHAATAAAYGLPPEEALKSITLYPAQILGTANRVGSLEAGKDATLFICDGDPLETPTQIEAAYVQGREVDLGDRHKRLNAKYGERLKRLGK
jgi:imidazolonepropionase-like amidohydrolase